jgi:hypothetical protein
MHAMPVVWTIKESQTLHAKVSAALAQQAATAAATQPDTDGALHACVTYVTHGDADFDGLNLALVKCFKERVAKLSAAPAAANAGEVVGREPYRALLTALDTYLTANDYGGLEVGKHHPSEVTQTIEAARIALSAKPVAWMNPDESCVMDAFIWSHDPQSPRYRVPVYDDCAAAVGAAGQEGGAK